MHSEIEMEMEWKPKLSSFVNIRERDGYYVLNNTKNGQRLLVNAEVINFVRLLDGTRTLGDISRIISSSNIQTDSAPLADFIKVNLGKRGFLEEYPSRQFKAASQVNLKIPIVSSRLLNSVPAPGRVQEFYKGRFFYIVLASLFSVHLFSFIQFGGLRFELMPIWVGIFLFFSHIFHELGHALACKSFGATSGTIGFGFYSIFPVFYIDLSDTWNLPANQRVKVNLGGIFADYILALICLVVYFLTGENSYLIAETLIFFKTFYNLNFLLRTDGYWVLSDLLKLPNLADASRRYVIDLLNSKAKLPKCRTDKIYLLYGMFSLLFWVVIMVYLLSNAFKIGDEVAILVGYLGKVDGIDQAGIKALFSVVTKIIITMIGGFILSRSFILPLLLKLKRVSWIKP
jgi:putative peptide zinc metalloprotease protein